ncbi:MAG: ATP-binding protein [Edaphobacter sp.]
MNQMAMTMRQSEEQMQQWQILLDSANEGIWAVDMEGNCTFINRIAASTLGFAMEQILGSNIHDLVHHHYPDGGRFPDSECAIYGVMRTKQGFSRVTETMFRKNGGSFLAELSAQPLLMDGSAVGVVITFREVTELRQQQENLRKAYEVAERKSAELDAVIESMPHGVYIATRDAKMRSNHVAKMMDGGEFPGELKTLQRALAGEWSTETVLASDRWIRSVAAPIFLNGHIVGGVAVNTDVTQARLQDEALRRSEKLAAVGQLASSIAHEINNPLESITNLLYLIRQSESMEDIKHYTALAQGELARVTEITLQTLRFNRQHSRPVEVDMAELSRTVMALYTGRVLVRNIEVEMKLMTAPRVMSLEGEIRQVVNNLVRNALEAMSGGGRLMVRLRPQRNWHSGVAGVRLTVADTGEGIGPKMRAHLFEPFHTTKEMTGTGLGLWVSKGIIDKHGGHIYARTRSGDGHGTMFSVWLPVEGSPNLEAQAD